MTIKQRIEAFLVRHNVVASKADSEYYAWADQRLDELAEIADQARRRKQQFADRGYRLPPTKGDGDPRLPGGIGCEDCLEVFATAESAAAHIH